jgi:DNA gyrase subunit A
MPVAPVARRGRNTQGVIFARPGRDDAVVAVTDAPETAPEDVVTETEAAAGDPATVGATSGSHGAAVQPVSGGGDSQATDAVPSETNDQVAPEADAADGPGTEGTGGSA